MESQTVTNASAAGTGDPQGMTSVYHAVRDDTLSSLLTQGGIALGGMSVVASTTPCSKWRWAAPTRHPSCDLGQTLLAVNARHERLIDGLLTLARSARTLTSRLRRRGDGK